ncbi:MAG TPA: hydrogenase formation protein HypD [Polyangiaceae bacterium]|nr:hydrogenase formation protein HypD [Polyangiaceae bacterium]
MKYLDEYRSRAPVERLVRAIERVATRPAVIMEICGGQTHSIVRHGLDTMLPELVELVHGPGCPVCVTPLEMIDRAHAIAARPGVIFCSFGDMLRVPGSDGDLLRAKARGADVRVVYSPLDALKLAEQNPHREVVFFAIGFETTAPANAMSAVLARKRNLRNFSLLVSHVLVPPAMEAILGAADNRVRGFLGPGHVCAVMGLEEYRPIAARHGVPIVVTGFEPVDLLEGILRVVTALEEGRSGVDNQYGRSVRDDGNRAARDVIDSVFEVCDRTWRGVGKIAASGYRLRDELRELDAEARFDVGRIAPVEPAECISGFVLRGVKKPHDCPAFGKRCTPETPLGATMVSSEGACAAYHAYAKEPRGKRLPLAGRDAVAP